MTVPQMPDDPKEALRVLAEAGINPLTVEGEEVVPDQRRPIPAFLIFDGEYVFVLDVLSDPAKCRVLADTTDEDDGMILIELARLARARLDSPS
jgi:hypothetical protein